MVLWRGQIHQVIRIHDHVPFDCGPYRHRFHVPRARGRLLDAMLLSSESGGGGRVAQSRIELEYPNTHNMPVNIEAYLTRDYHQVILGRKVGALKNNTVLLVPFFWMCSLTNGQGGKHRQRTRRVLAMTIATNRYGSLILHIFASTPAKLVPRAR